MKIENISTKVILPAYSRNYLQYSIKCMVENDTGEEDVSITLQGLDEEGYEIDTVTIHGTISSGGSKVMTTSDSMDKKLYDQIVSWREE